MKVVTIANANIQIVEYKKERVLTTDQLAQAYECDKQQVMQNFNNNKDRFEEGKHYFRLEGEELKAFKNCFENIEVVGIGKRAPFAYLWTRRGASRHCKMLGTDKAWEMFDALEENYFNPQQKPMTQLDILKQNIEILQEQERRLAHVELDIADVKETQRIHKSRIDTFNGVCTEGTKRQKLNSMISAYATKNGLAFSEAWRRFRKAYNTAFHTNITLSITHYMEKMGLKKAPSVPEFLELRDLLDDALRIADKMLNTPVMAI